MKKSLSIVVLGALMFVGALTAHAQSTSSDIACLTAQGPSEKAVCAWEDYRKDAVWLARAISRALFMVDGVQASMAPDDPKAARALLVESQEAWEAYRRATCDLEQHLYFGGDGTALAYSECLNRVTEARVEDLKVLLQESD